MMQPYYSIVSPTFNKCFAYVLYIKCLDALIFFVLCFEGNANRSKLEIIGRFDLQLMFCAEREF